MLVGGTEAVQFGFHSSLLLLRAGTTDDTLGGIYRAESAGPLHVEVGLDYGLYWSGQGEGEVR